MSTKTISVPKNTYSRRHRPHLQSHPTWVHKGGDSNDVRTANSIIVRDAAGEHWLVFPAHLPCFKGGGLADFSAWGDELMVMPFSEGDPYPIPLFSASPSPRKPRFKWSIDRGAMLDACALQIPAQEFEPYGRFFDANVLDLATEPEWPPAPEEPIFCFGWPGCDEKWPPRRGSLISGRMRDSHSAIMRDTCGGGFSGSPVLDSAYRLVGIVVGEVDGGEYFVSARTIWQLIHNRPVDPQAFAIPDRLFEKANSITADKLIIGEGTKPYLAELGASVFTTTAAANAQELLRITVRSLGGVIDVKGWFNAKKNGSGSYGFASWAIYRAAVGAAFGTGTLVNSANFYMNDGGEVHRMFTAAIASAVYSYGTNFDVILIGQNQPDANKPIEFYGAEMSVLATR